MLDNACYSLVQTLALGCEEASLGVLLDQLIEVAQEDGTPLQLRLVTFQTERGEIYRYLSNWLDLSALTIVRLYLWRWEIELLFAWHPKGTRRHLVFSHWYSENENGVRIQLFAGLICYILLRMYAASRGEPKIRIGLMRWIRQHLSLEVEEAALLAYEQAINSITNLDYCYTFDPLLQRN